MKNWKYQVYGVYGHTIATYPFGENETHHKALERARKKVIEVERTGKAAWVRLCKHV